MELTKYVIEIIRLQDNQFGYDEHYYFKGVNNLGNNTNIDISGNIWEAIRFSNYMSTEILAWKKFIKEILGKGFNVKITKVVLNYDLS